MTTNLAALAESTPWSLGDWIEAWSKCPAQVWEAVVQVVNETFASPQEASAHVQFAQAVFGSGE